MRRCGTGRVKQTPLQHSMRHQKVLGLDGEKGQSCADQRAGLRLSLRPRLRLRRGGLLRGGGLQQHEDCQAQYHPWHIRWNTCRNGDSSLGYGSDSPDRPAAVWGGAAPGAATVGAVSMASIQQVRHNFLSLSDADFCLAGGFDRQQNRWPSCYLRDLSRYRSSRYPPYPPGLLMFSRGGSKA